MLLQGSLRQFNLPNILQLVKMSGGTGALSLRRRETQGKIYFAAGSICYAYVTPQSVPIGQRFVNGHHVTPAQLRDAQAHQRERPGSGRLGSVLLELGFIDRATLDDVVREQIQDSVFDFFGWPDGEFEFNDDEVAEQQDTFVEMQVENVIMESCRRIDELEFVLEQLGSLESVPRLARGAAVDELGEARFSVEEWNCAVLVDGHRDVNTILLGCGYDRFYGAKVMQGLYARGFLTISPPATWSIGEGVSVGVCGATDAYNEAFVSALTDGNVVRQLHAEIVDGADLDVPVVAGRVRLHDGDGGDVFVFTVAAAAPESALTRVAERSSAWIVLVDARDEATVRAARGQLELCCRLGDAPRLIAAYQPVAGRGLGTEQVLALLDPGPGTPIVSCRLRDRASVLAVLRTAVERLEGQSPELSSQAAGQ